MDFEKFLKALRPTGPWTLTAIAVDEKSLPTIYTHDIERVKAFLKDPALERWGEASPPGRKYNFYTQANITRKVNSKARAVDIAEVVFAQVDIDKNAAGVRLNDAEKADIIERLKRSERPPTFIVDTGRGVQALWRYSGAYPDLETGARINEAILDEYGGDPGTWNPAQLIRLPGTINYPTAKKVAAGITEPSPARLVEVGERAYDWTVFPLAEARPGGVAEAIQNIGPAEAITLSELVRDYNISSTLERIIQHGVDPETTNDKMLRWSRSEYVHFCACSLVRAGVPLAVIKGVLLNPDFGIAEKTFDGTVQRSPENYAEREVTRANWAVRQAEIALDEAAIDDKWLTPENMSAAEKKGIGRFEIAGLEDLRDIPEPEWLIHELLQAESLTMFYGPPKEFKTYWTINAVCCLACGMPVGTRETRRARVLYIIGEGLADFMPRLRAWMHHNGKTYADMSWLKVIRHGVMLNEPPKDGPGDYHRLVHAIRKEDFPFDLIVFDTVNQNMVGDENKTEDMTKFKDRLYNLREETKAAILLIHHTAKSGKGGPRGSSVLAGAVDASLKIYKQSGYVRIYADMMRAAPGEWVESWLPVEVEYEAGKRPKPVMELAAEKVGEAKMKKASNAERVLWYLSEKPGGADPEEIMRELAVSKATLYRAFKYCEEHGLVSETGARLTDGKPAKVREITEKGEARVQELVRDGVSFRQNED